MRGGSAISATLNGATIQFSEDELDTLCQSLLQQLRLEWDNREENYLKAVSLWRNEFAPNFVEEQQRYLGKPEALNFTCIEAQQFLDDQSDVADLLEKLARSHEPKELLP